MKFLGPALMASALILCHGQEIAKPTLERGDPTWNWRDGSLHQVFYHTPAAGQGMAWVRLPFHTADNRVYSTVPDMDVEDGWMLVHRNFGRDGFAPAFPYFTLYNRYRGIFRIMIFNAVARDDSIYLGELFFLDWEKGRAAPLLTFTNNLHYSLTDYEAGQKEATFALMKTYNDWAVFDFTLAGYDPKLLEKDPILIFRLTGIASSTIRLDGKADIRLIQDTLQNQAAPSYSMGFHDLDWKKAYERGSTYYKSTKTFIEDVTSEKNKDKFYYKTALELSKTAVGTMAPWAGALIGVVQTFIGGTNQASEWEPISFTGQMNLTLEGQIDTKRQLWALGLYLNEGPLHVMAERPVQAIPWGIFTLKEPITFRMERLDRHRLNEPMKIRWTVGSGGEVELNPASRMRLKSIRYAFDMKKAPPKTGPLDLSGLFQSVDAGPPRYVDLHTLSSEGVVTEDEPGWQGVKGLHPEGVIVHMQFQTESPTRHSDSEITVIKKVAFPGFRPPNP